MRNHIYHVNLKFSIYLFISYSFVVFYFVVLLVYFAENEDSDSLDSMEEALTNKLKKNLQMRGLQIKGKEEDKAWKKQRKSHRLKSHW